MEIVIMQLQYQMMKNILHMGDVKYLKSLI